MTVPQIVIDFDAPRARLTDPSNGTRGRKRIDPLTRYVVDADGCWLWQGFVGTNGYGGCWTGGAHRHFYRKYVGEIPAGLHVDHVCHVPGECTERFCKHRRCVNPEHLKLATPKENVLRSNSFTAHYAAATHCPEGHPYAGENLVTLRKQRTCRICQSRRWKEAHARERMRVPVEGALNRAEQLVLTHLRERRSTDQDVAEAVGLSRQAVAHARGALQRGGLVVADGAISRTPGRRPATAWRGAPRTSQRLMEEQS